MSCEIEIVFKSLNYTLTKEEYQRALHFFSDERTEMRDLIEKLSWNETEEVQRKAIDHLADGLFPSEYIYLVLPDKYTTCNSNNQIKYYKQGTGKSRWENAAKTIVKIGWPKVDKIIVPLFIWLLDPNWPGSELIYNFILSLPKNVLTYKINEILDNPENYAKHDYEELKELIEEMEKDGGKERGKGTVCVNPTEK